MWAKASVQQTSTAATLREVCTTLARRRANTLAKRLARRGAGEGNRTPDPRITNALLYQLSYSGARGAKYSDRVPRAQPRRLGGSPAAVGVVVRAVVLLAEAVDRQGSAAVGGLGVHRFYLGYTWQGIVQLLTLGGCGIWALIDFIRIITGSLQPKDGEYETTL